MRHVCGWCLAAFTGAGPRMQGVLGYCSQSCGAKAQAARLREFEPTRRTARFHWTLLMAEEGPLCRICLYPVVPDAAWPDPCHPCTDHIEPLSAGGLDIRSNVQLAHNGCNLRKGTRTDAVSWAEWNCEIHPRLNASQCFM